MKRNWKLNAASLLCAMLITTSCVFAEDVSSYDELKEKVNSNSDIKVKQDIEFNGTIDLGKSTEEVNNVDITIQGAKDGDSSHATFTQAKEIQSSFNRDAFNVNKGSSLTLKNVTFKDFKGSSGVVFGAVIRNSGKLTITAEDGKNVIFTGNGTDRRGGGGDIYVDQDATTEINGTGGKVTLDAGLSGSGSVTHKGASKLEVGGINSLYSGNFVNESGVFELKKDATFFHGKSTFKDGELHWYTKNDLYDSTGTSVKTLLELQNNTKLVVGDGTNEANLTLKKSNSVLAQTIDITVSDHGTLTLYNLGNVTLEKHIKGNGKFVIDGINLTLDGSNRDEGNKSGIASTIKFGSRNNSVVNLLNFDNDTSLESIAAETAQNSGLILNLTDYIAAASSATVNINGTGIKELNINGSNNKITGQTVVSNNAKVSNNANNTEFTSGLKIQNANKADDFYSVVNDYGKTIVVQGTNGLENSGKINNKGNLKLEGLTNENKSDGEILNLGTLSGTNLKNAGRIDNTGDITIETVENENGTITSTGSGSLNFKNLTNSGTVDMRNANGAFTVSNTVSNFGTIQGNDMTFGALENQSQFDASGKLTLNGTGEDFNGKHLLSNTNNAQLRVNSLDVQGTIENSGTINVTDLLSASGKLTNNSDANVTFGSANLQEVENSGTITTQGNITASGKLTNQTNANITFLGGSLSDVENHGNITTSSDLSISGTITGNGGEIHNNGGNVTINGDASGYTGKYVQNDGSTTVTTSKSSNAKLFSGEKDIKSGSLTVTADRLDYNGVVKLGSNTKFDYTTYDMSGGIISEDLLQFTGTGATASFKGFEGNEKSTFTLKSGIQGSNDNNIAFSNAELKLESGSDGSLNYNYKDFTLKDSVLKLGELSDGDHSSVLHDYIFDSLKSENSSIDFNVHITNGDTDYLATDSLTVGQNSSGSLSLASVFISGEENATRGQKYSTKDNEGVIRGEGALTLSGDGTIQGATTKYTYDLDVNEDGRGVTLKVSGQADSNSLSDMNSGKGQDRFFQFSEGDDTDYHIDSSLGKTTEGRFTVSGKNANAQDSVLSGKLIQGSQITDNKGHFFDIDEDINTKLTVRNLTVKDADIAADENGTGGSVLKNNSETSQVVLDNVIVEGNSSSAEKGGAIYNNGGSGGEHTSENYTGLYVHNAKFSSNSSSSLGGAIYNDSQGHMVLEDVIVEGMNNSAKNDIYNAGEANVLGSNNFESDITNKGNFTFHSDNLDSEQGSLITKFTNEADAAVTFGGKNTITDLTNNADANFSGNNTIRNSFVNNTASNATNNGNLYISKQLENKGSLSNGGYLDFAQGSTVTSGSDGNNASITNKGGLLLSGDASGFKGTFTQSKKDDGSLYSDDVKTNVFGKFFGGNSTIEDGILNWMSQDDLVDGATLKVNGGTLNIGDGTEHAGKLTFKEGSSISEAAQTNIYSNGELDVAGADITLGNGSNWLGKVGLSNGSLTLDSVKSNGKLDATGGKLTLKNESNLTINENSKVAKEVQTDIQENSNVIIDNNGTFSVDNNDKWSGNILILDDSTGTLNIDGYNASSSIQTRDASTNGLLQAQSGNVNITGGSNVSLNQQGDYGSFVHRKAVVNIEKGSTVNVQTGGELTLNDGDYADTWSGNVNLDGGTFDYGMKSIDGTLTATKGNLNLLSDSILTIVEPSDVQDAVAVDIQKGATVDLKSGKFNLDEETNDKWHGLIKNEGGTLTAKGIENSTEQGGGLQQTGGNFVLDENSKVSITGNDSYIKGGNVEIKNNSSLMLGKAVQEFYADNLKMSENAVFALKNGEIKSIEARNVDISDNANFTVDIDPRARKADTFKFDSLNASNAQLNVYDFDFLGKAPIDETVELQLFDGDINGDITFSASNALKDTPIGTYGLQAIGNGRYRAYLDTVNPHTYRGQAATLAAYTNQVMFDDILTNHFVLHEERFIDNAKNANKYADAQSLFVPYQKTYENGGLWAKTYASFNRLDMTHNLDVGSNVWGTLVGADFKAADINNNWKFIPTVFMAYNGGRQHYKDVRMNQEGGQLGLMGTFIGHNDSVTSVAVYGGGYMNDMDVDVYRDNAGNWYTGAVIKSAYNFHPFEDFIFQPNVFASYNLFGKQNWGTDFGEMSMNSGMLNAFNAAPGLNLILAKRTWSLYATFQYMFFINDGIDGMAGNVNLPKLHMDHGYIQYGLGGTKVIKDKLGLYGQLTLRNAGINGIGCQFGLNYILGDVTSSYYPKIDRKKYDYSRIMLKP